MLYTYDFNLELIDLPQCVPNTFQFVGTVMLWLTNLCILVLMINLQVALHLFILENRTWTMIAKSLHFTFVLLSCILGVCLAKLKGSHPDAMADTNTNDDKPGELHGHDKACFSLLFANETKWKGTKRGCLLHGGDEGKEESTVQVEELGGESLALGDISLISFMHGDNGEGGQDHCHLHSVRLLLCFA